MADGFCVPNDQDLPGFIELDLLAYGRIEDLFGLLCGTPK
ncbi:hypothetical protein ACVIHF_000844 [Bradyrhizobium sp. USDA 4506]